MSTSNGNGGKRPSGDRRSSSSSNERNLPSTSFSKKLINSKKSRANLKTLESQTIYEGAAHPDTLASIMTEDLDYDLNLGFEDLPSSAPMPQSTNPISSQPQNQIYPNIMPFQPQSISIPSGGGVTATNTIITPTPGTSNSNVVNQASRPNKSNYQSLLPNSQIIIVDAPPLRDVNGTCYDLEIVKSNIAVLRDFFSPSNVSFTVDYNQRENQLVFLNMAHLNELIKHSVSIENIEHYRKMIMKYYKKYFLIMQPLCSVIVNLNYTVNSSNIVPLLLNYINKCVSMKIEKIKNVLLRQPNQVESMYTILMQNKFNNLFQRDYELLVNLFNRQLFNLQAIDYYKYTGNNDVNNANTYVTSQQFIKVNINVISFCGSIQQQQL
ncbi:hypothetical protein [Ectropis obliqua nucleopolyhedrovirus]|uniref:Uncharacterized protein n=1 Tax=Ectropis obliqua nucleopolyhedrovirus TaxID=59376 RepID=A0EYT9_9ABAC|nr:hypothetical protein EONV_gp036 [Ectropis obliqua nucleopolyhedrovirus]ABI35720.1 hypothetical protein [Ectropis obliqua nucleopolyhedrovirus]AGS47896.1 hypothetical protein wdlz-06GM49 [Ectropis obliqua nucleopolyhedrovirus]QWV59695.1 hypothetical protein EONV_gp036 [Ectropis obliqua nucleopolyhedrovirus]UYO72834.1 hypothetical protein EONV-gp036 [Ectropis obliqua nucleopolyhedrovirus]